MKNICDWKKCNKIAKYRAPVERDNSKKFKWLCLDHVKEFNKSWDYFKGMSDQKIRQFLKSDIIWHKETQSFSSPNNFFKILWKNTLNDEIDILNNYKYYKKIKMDKNFTQGDEKAFKIIGLEVGANWEEIQNKFKSLVKKFHPDMNSGNKKFEEKLKMVTLAYTQLKAKYREK